MPARALPRPQPRTPRRRTAARTCCPPNGRSGVRIQRSRPPSRRPRRAARSRSSAIRTSQSWSRGASTPPPPLATTATPSGPPRRSPPPKPSTLRDAQLATGPASRRRASWLVSRVPAEPRVIMSHSRVPPLARLLPLSAAPRGVRSCFASRIASSPCLPTASVSTWPIELAERVLELRVQRRARGQPRPGPHTRGSRARTRAREASPSDGMRAGISAS